MSDSFTSILNEAEAVIELFAYQPWHAGRGSIAIHHAIKQISTICLSSVSYATLRFNGISELGKFIIKKETHALTKAGTACNSASE